MVTCKYCSTHSHFRHICVRFPWNYCGNFRGMGIPFPRTSLIVVEPKTFGYCPTSLVTYFYFITKFGGTNRNEYLRISNRRITNFLVRIYDGQWWPQTSVDWRKAADVQRVLDKPGRRNASWRQQRSVNLQPTTSGCRLVLGGHAPDHVLGACALAAGDVTVAQVLDRTFRPHVGNVRPHVLTICDE